MIVAISVLFGMAYAYAHHLDGAQTFIVCAFAWMCVNSLYHAARAFMPRYRRDR